MRKVAPIMKYKRGIKKSGDSDCFGGKDEYGSICAVFQLIPIKFTRRLVREAVPTLKYNREKEE